MLLIRTCAKFYSSAPFKLNVALVGKLRKEMECSISKAKDALTSTKNDYDAAIEWLKNDQLASAAKKQEKLSSRIAVEGLIGISVHEAGINASLVELNCETDFVAKSPAFVDLVSRIANTAVLYETGTGQEIISPIDIESLSKRNIVDSEESLKAAEEQKTIQEACTQVIGKLGENIKLRRGFIGHQVGLEPLIFGGYAHTSAGLPSGLGRLGSLVCLKSSGKLSFDQRKELAGFAKKIAQHVSGFAPQSIGPSEGVPEESVLLNQPYLFGGGTITEILQKQSESLNTKLSIIDIKRYECGEGLEKKVDNFAEEVMAQIKN
ncbi:Elongation factor Ts, mitochondrial [Boothiomyces macroporosus]|uniref:Elongation factor Ts, mitochondrial n=1 Tax=Boothiomyces macroporosus TaxID=261099 RepID=A0AAD5UIB4_9FUNG|nr:Elongation factor Ts, mitochondrial [Boothiomyces macroporosus]